MKKLLLLFFLLPALGYSQRYDIIKVDSSVVGSDSIYQVLETVFTGQEGQRQSVASKYLSLEQAKQLRSLLYSAELAIMDSGLRAINEQRRAFLAQELRRKIE